MLNRLDQMSTEEAENVLRQCCGATLWCRKMVEMRPFVQATCLHDAADRVFDQFLDDDWIEAFECHPKIGDLESMKLKFAGNDRWSSGEQSGICQADQDTLRALVELNRTYQAKFGYIFIICASGKSAAQMLAAIRDRIVHDPATELKIAAEQQRQITHLRIDKLLQTTHTTQHPMRSPITTHVLNTATGQPATGILVTLQSLDVAEACEVGRGVTDAEGRITHGLIGVDDFHSGTYQLRFEVASYFEALGAECFYPSVVIMFKVSPDQTHYHVPLLISPFGFTTYRGS